MIKKFIRRDFKRFSKIGKNRKKLQKWRKPRGRDNKIRENRKGYPKSVKIGYKKSKKVSGKINGLNWVRIVNLRELKNVNEKEIIIIGKVGAKKKMELLKTASELKLKILNLKSGGIKDDSAK